MVSKDAKMACSSAILQQSSTAQPNLHRVYTLSVVHIIRVHMAHSLQY